MFGKLQGAVEYVGVGFVILLVSGVGFKVLLPENILARQKVGKNAAFWIETIVRQDAIQLIGFDAQDEQDMFQKLVGVSGIGTKLALAVIGAFRQGVLRTAIASGDAKTLSSVPGVGKKVAERIIVELRGKVDGALASSESDGDVYGDVLSALESLGYRRADSVELVQKLIKENPNENVQSLLTKALKEYAVGK
ncbi:MAG: Holliday junction branch migration protein RuvA [Rickettsiales bacterium]|jgi:Holliday junction DNA helicase RuvA|nr:Holliday junction branch migration protein RuvA [Rickettsiales bacterium]